MNYTFSKYQGTGNDFILLDGILSPVHLTGDQIRLFCDRRFGVGADGLIIMESTVGADFRMRYFNSDGKEGSMCGNGGRCIVRFAFEKHFIKEETTFIAVDGIHKAIINNTDPVIISLLMKDVHAIEMHADHLLVNTGSPHYVTFVQHADEINVNLEGSLIRYSERFIKQGINVNFVEVRNDGLYIRTYERGVENETLSCGTGVTASVLAAFKAGKINDTGSCKVITPGGILNVQFKSNGNGFNNIYLEGPAEFVFEGEITL